MKKVGRILVVFACVVALIAGTAITALAHSGRTDSSGGHKDNKNKSGLGGYHYHCGGYPAHLHVSGYCPYRDVFPKGVSIKADKTTLGIGETVSISAVVSPSNACNTSVDWSCSDTSVIRLSSGKIEAVGYGTAVLTAETFNGRTSTLKITVKEITAQKVSISASDSSDKTIYIGDTLKLSATITPENVDNPSIVWSSSDESVAVVDARGTVKTLSEGTAIIYATAANGVAGKMTVKVNEKYVESVELAKENMDVYLRETHKMTATVLPSDATFPQLTWTSSDPMIVEVAADGTLYANSCGTATVTAMSTNGIADSVTVTVSEIIAERIEILGEASLLIGSIGQLKVNFYPQNTSAKDIEWSTNNDTVVVVDDDGTIKALQIGVAIITATQKDTTASIEIEVAPKLVEQIEISSSLGTSLNVGDFTTLSAIVYPADATYPDITWETSDPEVVVVNEHGEAEAKSLGNAIITARAADGFEETIKINVRMETGATALIAGAIVAAGAGGVLLKKKKAR